MVLIDICLIIESFILGYFIYRYLKPNGTLTVDETDPDDVKMELTGVNVLDMKQKFYILRVNRYRTSRK